MAHGKTIRIHLPDGSPSGLRHAEIVNWTGQAMVCPRGRCAELGNGNWLESERPGVYFLVGDDSEGVGQMVYIGEAENVRDRLRTHLGDRGEDFWNQVVFFTSKDANLTKSQVKYLESRLVAIAREVGRVSLVNGNTPQPPALPRPDRDAMEEFLNPLRLLLAALGFPLLQPLLQPTPGAVAAEETGTPGPLASVPLRFRVHKHGVEAIGRATDEGLVVLPGSRGSAEVRETLSPGWRRLRERLVADGVITESADGIVFARRWRLASPGAAAAILVGRPENGRVTWRDAERRSLADLEHAAMPAADTRA